MSKHRRRGSKYYRAIQGKRWQRVRRLVLDRDNYRCQHCGEYGNEVDHIIPLEKQGDPYDMGNLQTLCGGRGGCHHQKTNADRGIVPDPEQEKWKRYLDMLYHNVYNHE